MIKPAVHCDLYLNHFSWWFWYNSQIALCVEWSERGRWNCETSNCEKGISGTKMQGWNLRDMESAGKAEYAFHLSIFQDSRRATSTSILNYMFTAYLCVRLWHCIPTFSF